MVKKKLLHPTDLKQPRELGLTERHVRLSCAGPPLRGLGERCDAPPERVQREVDVGHLADPRVFHHLSDVPLLRAREVDQVEFGAQVPLRTAVDAALFHEELGRRARASERSMETRSGP